MRQKTLINPPELAKPRGFNHAVLVEGGRTLFLAGQDASDARGEIIAPGDVVRQYEQVIRNLQAVVEAAGGTLQDIVKLNIYTTDRADYLAHAREIGELHRRYFGNYYPAMAFFEVKSLFQSDALIEMEGIAHLKNSDK